MQLSCVKVSELEGVELIMKKSLKANALVVVLVV